MANKNNLICFQELWSIAVGQSFGLQEPDLVQKELLDSVNALRKGLNYFTNFSGALPKKLREEENVSDDLLKFLLKAAQFLDLDGLQMHGVYNSFISTHFRGSTDKLKQMLKEEKSNPILLNELSNYYFTERLYLLRTIAPIIGYFQDKGHPYQTVYAEVLSNLPHIAVTLQKQLELSLKVEPPQSKKDINYAPDMLKRLSLQRVKEQCEILELIFLYHSHFAMPSVKLLSLVKLFKEYGFGLDHPFVDVIDPGLLSPLLSCMNALQQVIIIEGFDMELLQESDATEEHSLIKNKKEFEEVDEILFTRIDDPLFSPLLLSWATVRHLLLEDNGGVATQKLGERAVSHKVWHRMATLVKVYPFNTESNVAMTAKRILREVLSCVTKAFHEDTLGDYSDLISIATVLLGESAKTGSQGMQSCSLDALLLSSAGYFPLIVEPMLSLLCCMVKSQTDALQVHAFISNLPIFAEYIATCTRDEIESLPDASCWKLLSSKPIRTAGGLHTVRLPMGTIGQLVNSQYGAMVQWQHNVDGWKVLYAEMKSLMDYEGPSSNLELLGYFQKTDLILRVIESMLTAIGDSSRESTACLAVLETLGIFVMKIHRVIQRIVQTTSPPISLMESCIRCMIAWLKINPEGYAIGVMNQLSIMQYLPSTDRLAFSISHDDDNLHTGVYGVFLTECERPAGCFLVTIATIELITFLLESALDRDQSIVASLSCSVEFILNEVFSSFLQWQKKDVESWDKIGIRCLEMCHVILCASSRADSSEEADRRLQRNVVDILSCSSIARVVMRLTCINVDNLHAVAANEPFSIVAMRLIETIKIGFSLLNNLLRIESSLIPSNELQERSYLHQVLATPTTGDSNLISAVAGYLYHQQDLSLPRLAIALLRRISLVAPMSLHACLGPDVAAIRDILLMRLKSRTEDTAIKIGILELFVSSVQTQPGLLELFLDLQSADKDKPESGVTLGKKSCLSAVLTMLNPLYQGTYKLPPRLHTACVKLLNALWVDRRHFALQALRSTSANEGLGFWSAVLFPLFSENSPKDIAQNELLETCAHVLNIVGLEWFYTSRSESDESLEKVMKEFTAKKRFEHWSKVLLCVAKTLRTSKNFERRRHHMFASAWRSFVSTAVIMTLDVQEKVLDDLVEAISFLVDDAAESSDDVVIMDLISDLLLSLVYKQLKPKKSSAKQSTVDMQVFLPRIVTCIQKAHQNRTLARVSTNLQTVSIHIVKQLASSAKKIKDESCITDLVEATCEHLAILLRDPDTNSLKNSEIPVLLVRSLEALFLADQTDNQSWLKIVSRESTVNLMMMVLVRLLASCPQDIDLIRLSVAFMRLLTFMSTNVVTSRMMFATGLFPQFCLNLSNSYNSPNKKWLEVYHLSLVLMSRMICSLSHDFIVDVLDFVGVHLERMIQCLCALPVNQKEMLLREVTYTTALLATLSRDFTHQWKYKLRHTFESALKHTLVVTHSCVAMLLQPRLLLKKVKFLEKKDISPKSTSSLRARAVRKSLSKVQEDEPSNPEASAMQESLFSILGNCLDFLNNLSPNICQITFDQGIDPDEYNQLLSINFASPTLDQESELTFGAVISAANIALAAIHKFTINEDKRSSHHDALIFVADSALVLLMSQCLLTLKQPHISHRNKQVLKRELADELSSCVRSASRHLRHSSSSYSPHSSPSQSQPLQTISGRSPAVSSSRGILDLVTAFVKQLIN